MTKTTKTNAQHVAEHRQRKRARGLCAWGGCTTPSTTVYCADHRAMLKAASKRRQRRARNEKLLRDGGTVTVRVSPVAAQALLDLGGWAPDEADFNAGASALLMAALCPPPGHCKGCGRPR